jgi:hypothetical protein
MAASGAPASIRRAYALATSSIGSAIDGSSFSGLFTRVEIATSASARPGMAAARIALLAEPARIMGRREDDRHAVALGPQLCQLTCKGRRKLGYDSGCLVECCCRRTRTQCAGRTYSLMPLLKFGSPCHGCSLSRHGCHALVALRRSRRVMASKRAPPPRSAAGFLSRAVTGRRWWQWITDERNRRGTFDAGSPC